MQYSPWCTAHWGCNILRVLRLWYKLKQNISCHSCLGDKKTKNKHKGQWCMTVGAAFINQRLVAQKHVKRPIWFSATASTSVCEPTWLLMEILTYRGRIQIRVWTGQRSCLWQEINVSFSPSLSGLWNNITKQWFLFFCGLTLVFFCP